MLEDVSKAAFSILGGSVLLKRLASRYGMLRDDSFARRFVAGQTIQEAIAAARQIEASGLTITLDHLGEQVATTEAATAATRDYLAIIPEMTAAGIGRNLSVKLTQLGIDVDRATSVDNLRRIFEAGLKADFFVRVDMEKSIYTELTLDAFETLWRIGYERTGIAIQACLRRSASDIDRLNAMGASVRLVKGAYVERDAHPWGEATDRAYAELARRLHAHGVDVALATHDERLQDVLPRARVELLLGVRPDLARRLASQGRDVRIYVPYGADWFRYFMRRRAEAQGAA